MRRTLSGAAMIGALVVTAAKHYLAVVKADNFVLNEVGRLVKVLV